MQDEREPGEHHGQHVDGPLLGHDRRVEHGQAGEAHQSDERGGCYLPRVVGRIQPTGIRNGNDRSHQVDHYASPHCRCAPALRPVTPTSQTARYASRFGRFSPSEQQCRAGVSASSPPCFGLVNPHAPSTSRRDARQRPRPRSPPPLRSPDLAHRRAHHDPPGPAPPGPSGRPHRHPAPLRHPAPRSASPRYAAPACRSTAAVSPRSFLGIVLATLAVLVVVFAVVGAHKNHQIDELHNQGVAVAVTVTACQGLLGGSGSNGAGYACRGSYELDGHHYNEPLPGTALHAPGPSSAPSPCPGIRPWSRPSRSSTPSTPRRRSSSSPPSSFVVLVAIVVVVLLRRRRKPGGARRRRGVNSEPTRAEPRGRQESQAGGILRWVACSACSSGAVTRSGARLPPRFGGDVPPPSARLSACCRR